MIKCDQITLVRLEENTLILLKKKNIYQKDLHFECITEGNIHYYEQRLYEYGFFKYISEINGFTALEIMSIEIFTSCINRDFSYLYSQLINLFEMSGICRIFLLLIYLN